jgi:hypothetical protein
MSSVFLFVDRFLPLVIASSIILPLTIAVLFNVLL